MKLRILFYTILTVCLLNVAGYFPMFELQKGLIHHQIEALIEQSFSNDQLNLISISSENQHEIRWERTDKEFWYKGQLYDIVRSEKKQGVTEYYCIEDTSETRLAYQFIETIKKQTDDDNGENTPLSNFFKKQLKIYFAHNYVSNDSTVLVKSYKKNKVLVPYLNLYVSTVYEAVDPPPKRLV